MKKRGEFGDWLRGGERRNGPWVKWLGWTYRGRLGFRRHRDYRTLCLGLFFVDWVRPR
jgi:hypothetical protein